MTEENRRASRKWRALGAGVASGAAAAIAASLLSLPLESPDDAFFNTGSMTLGCLAAGLAAAALWRRWTRSERQQRLAVAAIVTFAAVAIATLGAEALPGDPPLDRLPGFILPLTAVALGTIAIIFPLLYAQPLRLRIIAPGMLAASVALGAGLAGQGDGESGRLSLEDLPAPAVLATRTPTATPAPAPEATAEPSPAPGIPASPAAPATATRVPGGYVIASEQSTATYTVREKLASLPLPNEAVGKTNAITGTIYLNGGVSTVTVDLRTLTSDQSRRDRYIRTDGGIQSNRYPYAVFTATDVQAFAADMLQGKTATGTLAGRMTIREVERPFSFQIEARLADGVFQLHGAADFTWADFNIPPPNIRGFVQVENNVHIEVLLVARRQG